LPIQKLNQSKPYLVYIEIYIQLYLFGGITLRIVRNTQTS